MARNISAQAIAKLAQPDGAEPVMVVSIAWVFGSSTFINYATKDIEKIASGKVIDIGTVDSVVAISLNDTSDEVSIMLDDTDGSIKNIIDFNDVHLRDVKIYQWFEGLPWENRFLVFQGKINSPITWSETDRTVKFSVVSQLEDKDVGFSPEEGVFSDLPNDMVGKLWPECFGTSVHQKAIQVDFKHTGSLGEPVGIADFTIPSRITAIGRISGFLKDLGLMYSISAGIAGFLGLVEAKEQLQDKAANFFGQAAQRDQTAADLNEIYQAQLDTEVSSFRVIGGEDFPRGTLKLIINDAIFTGSFQGALGQEGADRFAISCQDHPERKNFHKGKTPCGNPGCGFNTGDCKSFPVAEGDNVQSFFGGSKFFLPSGAIVGEQAGAFFAQGGSSVTIYTNEPLRYFVSITPGTVTKVTAFSTFKSGQRILVNVPTNAYTVSIKRYGSVSVTVVTVKEALSKLTPPFEDTIYVTFKSSVGPNTMDIMKYLINKYADITFDAASFNKCRAALRAYPMHFCLTQKKNIVTVLKDLAFMSRTSISIKNGKFFCNYIPEQPTPIFTFNEDNVLSQSVELGFTDTEDLVTKYVANWRVHGAQEEDNVAVIRYNVKKYGTHQTNVDMYAYNYLAAIIKTLTFWINRRGHTWKKLRFKAALDALNVETLDGVLLDFSNNYIANEPVIGFIEEGNYNSKDNTLDFVVWTGVRSGDMTQYDLAYPQKVSTFLRFPDAVATASGFGGGDGPGNTSSGIIGRVGNSSGVSVTVGGETDPDPYDSGTSLKQDLGGKKPSDVGDVSPGEPDSKDTGTAEQGTAGPATPGIVQRTVDDPGNVFWIDIRSTPIADSDNPGTTATLDTFFEEVGDSKLKARTDATWKDSSDEGEFDFKFDGDGGKFGAGTAFLKDD